MALDVSDRADVTGSAAIRALDRRQPDLVDVDANALATLVGGSCVELTPNASPLLKQLLGRRPGEGGKHGDRSQRGAASPAIQ